VILALDLSSHCGWAAGIPGERPLFGVWELPSVVDPGRQAAAFCDVLADAITTFAPSLVIMEANINLHRQNPDSTALQQIGMVYVTDLVCYRRSVKLVQNTAEDARKVVLGRARWSEKGGAKDAVLGWCREHEYSVLNHNAADAIVLWHFADIKAARKRAA
jgi:hypothetical protein